MAETQPFVLLDDARAEGASDAHLFENPREVFVARRPEEVLPVFEAADAARVRTGGTLAGYLAYEAGLAIEPRLMPLAAARSGAGGPLVWFGLFDAAATIPAAEVQFERGRTIEDVIDAGPAEMIRGLPDRAGGGGEKGGVLGGFHAIQRKDPANRGDGPGSAPPPRPSIAGLTSDSCGRPWPRTSSSRRTSEPGHRGRQSTARKG